VVAAASYEARRHGVRSAMPMSRAVRLCPELMIVPPNFAKYRGVSQQVLAILRQATPLVEPLSLELGRKGLVARTVTIKIRYGDFITITRSHSHEATSDPDELVRRAVALLEKTEAGRRPVRLLGAGVHNLEPLGARRRDTVTIDGAQLLFEES
jgi:nucleotidyltransferase/DNA polymerase involved in DNA repair